MQPPRFNVAKNIATMPQSGLLNGEAQIHNVKLGIDVAGVQ